MAHPASVVEARLRAVVTPVLRGRGWRPVVTAYTGYGGQGWVRLLARVLLVPPGSVQPARPGRGWRRFASPSAGGVPVQVRVGDRVHEVHSDADGYLDLHLEADLGPGWREATLEVEGAAPVSAPLRVLGADTRLGMVSDVDDTVIVTMLPRPLLAFRNAFLLREEDRRPVPGMAALYREIVTAHPEVFVVYLSTGAWNTAPALTGFLRRHGYPPGPLLMTDWGPTQQAFFRSGPEHKRTQLARLLSELPDLRWLLVGDDGQHDPSLYAEAAATYGDRVLGTAIRRLSTGEHLAEHGGPQARDTVPGTGGDLPGDPVTGPDGAALAAGLRRRGWVL